MKVEHFLTHIDHKEDLDYLKRPLHNVNMRLFRSSTPYRLIVKSCCEYVKAMALATMEGYKKPHGMSGANLAVPFNIIAVVRHRNTIKENVLLMINPIINYTGDETIQVRSNCGSIRLKESINVTRFKLINVSWFDEEGRSCANYFNETNGALTIQHEIDHNLGILITDRKS